MNLNRYYQKKLFILIGTRHKHAHSQIITILLNVFTFTQRKIIDECQIKFDILLIHARILYVVKFHVNTHITFLRSYTILWSIRFFLAIRVKSLDWDNTNVNEVKNVLTTTQRKTEESLSEMWLIVASHRGTFNFSLKKEKICNLFMVDNIQNQVMKNTHQFFRASLTGSQTRGIS